MTCFNSPLEEVNGKQSEAYIPEFFTLEFFSVLKNLGGHVRRTASKNHEMF